VYLLIEMSEFEENGIVTSRLAAKSVAMREGAADEMRTDFPGTNPWGLYADGGRASRSAASQSNGSPIPVWAGLPLLVYAISFRRTCEASRYVQKDGVSVENVAFERGLDVRVMDHHAGIPGIGEKNLKAAFLRCLPESGEHCGFQFLDCSALGSRRLRRDREVIGTGKVTSLAPVSD
jgi:hypothetical protein